MLIKNNIWPLQNLLSWVSGNPQLHPLWSLEELNCRDFMVWPSCILIHLRPILYQSLEILCYMITNPHYSIPRWNCSKKAIYRYLSDFSSVPVFATSSHETFSTSNNATSFMSFYCNVMYTARICSLHFVYNCSTDNLVNKIVYNLPTDSEEAKLCTQCGILPFMWDRTELQLHIQLLMKDLQDNQLVLDTQMSRVSHPSL